MIRKAPIRWQVIAQLAIAIACPSLGASAHAATLYSCPGDPSGASDNTSRGFHVINYPGTTLDDLSLRYFAGSGDGSYSITLTAHLGSYDGPVIGTTQQQTVMLSGSAGTPVTYQFGGVSVPAGSTVAFTQTVVSGPIANASARYDTGLVGGYCADVIQTDGTNAPLDLFRRPTVGVTITGAASAPIAVHSVGGAVSGLAGTHAGLRLRLNSHAAYQISDEGTFHLPQQLPAGTPYSVTVAAQPTNPEQTCAIVANGTGTIGNSDVSNVQVQCVPGLVPPPGAAASVPALGSWSLGLLGALVAGLPWLRRRLK